MSFRATIPLFGQKAGIIRDKLPFRYRKLEYRVKVAEERERELLANPPPTASPIQFSKNDRYEIVRTDNGGLPVYSRKWNDGRVWTTVRKVNGDVKALQQDLNAYFKKIHIDPIRDAPQASIRPTNQHIIFRGRYVDEVRQWMEMSGW